MSNRVKQFFICCICFLTANTSLAGDRTEREMLSIAERQLIHLSGVRRANAQVTIEKLVDERAYCIYGAAQGGFVVVSRNDNRMPVLGYSESKYDADQLPCGLKWWLNTVSASENSSRRAQAARFSFTEVEPFLKTVWGQGDPYNYLTPIINEKRTPTGCVATAMAQVMNYFGYPAHGKGDGYYTKLGEVNRYNNPIKNQYEWDKMLDDYTNVELNEQIRLPIARLMQDAGLASHMNYGTDGSGTHSQDAALGFAYNFEYDSLAIHCYTRDFFDDDAWMQMIYNELAQHKPIMYAATDGSGGHEFVFDGVDSEGRIHVNWGWNGTANGFFEFSDLCPEVNYNIHHYNYNQDMIVGFRCNPTPLADASYQSLWCTREDYSVSLSSNKNALSVSLTADGTYNYHFLTFYGSLGVAIESTDGHKENDKYIPVTDFSFGPQATFWGKNNFSFNNSYYYFMNPEYKLVTGNYRVFFASKAIQDETPQPVRCFKGPVCYQMTVNEDGSLSLSETKEPYTTAISDVRMYDSSSPVRYYDLQGREVDASAHGVLIMKQGNKTRKVVR